MGEIPYKPQFPNMHRVLLEMYSTFMSAKPDEVEVCRQRLTGVIFALVSLNDDRALSSSFMRNFCHDIQDVIGRVRIDPLREQELFIRLPRLKRMFGGAE